VRESGILDNVARVHLVADVFGGVEKKGKKRLQQKRTQGARKGRQMDGTSALNTRNKGHPRKKGRPECRKGQKPAREKNLTVPEKGSPGEKRDIQRLRNIKFSSVS